VASGPDKSTGTGASASSPSITPTNPNELVIACNSVQSHSGAYATSVASPMTFGSGAWQTVFGASSAYQIQGGTASAVSASFSGGVGEPTTTITSFYSTESPATLAITTTAVPEGFKSTSYTATSSIYSNCLAATGGDLPYTWSITSGSLPSGMSLNSSTGCITGTPSASQAATNITYKVTDSNSPTSSTTVTLPMTVAATALSLGANTCTGSALNGTQYQSFGGCSLAGSGGTSPYTYLYNSASRSYAFLPEGLSVNSSTGAITSSLIGGQGEYGTQFILTDNLGSSETLLVTFALTGNNAWAYGIFPSDSVFYRRIDSLPVDTSPAAAIYSGDVGAALTAGFGAAPQSNTPNGIPMIEVPYTQSYVTITGAILPNWYFDTAPIPSYAPVESSTAGGDRHVLVYQESGTGVTPGLFELYEGVYSGSSSWSDTGQGLWSNTTTYTMPPQDNGTTDAAGLPVLPFTVNADEVIGTGTPSSPNGTVKHAIRFTVGQSLNRYVWPATARAGVGSCTGGYVGSPSTDTGQISQGNPPVSCTTTGPMGEIYRLKSSVSTPSCASSSPQSAIIITGLRDYGIILADNGGSGDLIGTPDSRWNDTDLACLGQLHLSDFEPVNVWSLIPSANLPVGCPGTNGDCATLNSYQANQPAAGQSSSPQMLFGANQ
jgi:hypothetical protein